MSTARKPPLALKTPYGDQRAPDGNRVHDNFSAWYGQSKLLNEDGAPLVLYKGNAKVPKCDHFVTRMGRATASFTPDPHAASVYARTPEMFSGANYKPGAMVGAYYLALENPLDLRSLGENNSLWSIVNATGLFDPESHLEKHIGIEDIAEIVRGLEDLKNHFDYNFGSACQTGIFRITEFEEFADAIEQIDLEIDYESLECMLMDFDIDVYAIVDTRAFTELAKRLGFDGVIHKDVFDAGVEFYEGDKTKLEDGFTADHIIDTYRPFSMAKVKSATGNCGLFSRDSKDVTDRASIDLALQAKTELSRQLEADVQSAIREHAVAL